MPVPLATEMAVAVDERVAACDIFVAVAAVAYALGRRHASAGSYDPSPPPAGPHASAWLARALAQIGIGPAEIVLNAWLDR